MISVAVEMPDLAELLKDETRDIVRLVTIGTADRMKVLISEPKSGKSYKRGKKNHVASSPGEAPASDSSNLITSIMPIPIDDLRGEINLAVHGLFLEFGADGAGRSKTVSIAPRPFIIPSLEEVLADL